MIRFAFAGLLAFYCAASPCLAQTADSAATSSMLDRAQILADKATGTRLLESHEVRGHSNRYVRPESSLNLPSIADKVKSDALRKRGAGDATPTSN